MLATVADILLTRATHGPRALDADELVALQARRRPAPPADAGAVALIPVHGVIAPRITGLSDISGGATFQGLSAAVNAAADDPRTRAIVLDIDSPGGSVLGARVFARDLLRARTKVPVIACVQYQGTSAAYWAAACATEVVAAPGAIAGGIGVYLIHDDITKLLDQKGITRTLLHAGEQKLDGNENVPLGERAKARLQALVVENYRAFVGDVALGRGQSAAHIEDTFGKGGVVTAEEGLERGMVDKIATVEETLARFGVSPSSAVQPAALAPALGTPQEAETPTGQDRAAQMALERTVLTLGL